MGPDTYEVCAHWELWLLHHFAELWLRLLDHCFSKCGLGTTSIRIILSVCRGLDPPSHLWINIFGDRAHNILGILMFSAENPQCGWWILASLVPFSKDLSQGWDRHSLVPFASVYLHQHLTSKASSCPRLPSYNQPHARNVDFNPNNSSKAISPSASVKMLCWDRSVFLSASIPPFNSSLITMKGSSFFIHLPSWWRLIWVPWRQLINYLMFVCIFTNIRPNLHHGTSHPYSMCHNYCFAISHQQKFIKTSRLINSKWS